MPICTDYPTTKDCFSYILLGAPEFSLNRNASLDSVFSDIDSGIQAIAARIKNPDALRLFEQCRKELRTTLQLYKEGKLPEARKQVFHAEQIFVEAGKLRKIKSPKMEPVTLQGLKIELVEDDYHD